MVKDGMQQQGGGRGGNVDAGDGASASAEVVHCQVKRIKREDVEKGMEQAPSTESRRAAGFGGLSRRMSRSPLGRTGQPIPVGD